jgi:sulfate permease, SulP family
MSSAQTNHNGSLAPLVRYVPGLALFRGYRRDWLTRDVLAGISVCVVMIPSVIAYAGLMGLPPQHGLYAALVPLLVYPFFGSSRQVVVGPDIAISLLVASAISPLAGGDTGRLVGLAATVAVLSGWGRGLKSGRWPISSPNRCWSAI